MEMLVIRIITRFGEKIRRYADGTGEAFCCLGDFNVIPCIANKFGGSDYLNVNNRSFCDLI
jgi:hypothetical protein